jgi:hypothetical protein
MNIPDRLLEKINDAGEPPAVESNPSRRLFINTVLVLLSLVIVTAYGLVFGEASVVAIKKWWEVCKHVVTPPLLPGDPCPGCGMG